jgi:hypothetical protein
MKEVVVVFSAAIISMMVVIGVLLFVTWLLERYPWAMIPSAFIAVSASITGLYFLTKPLHGREIR